MSLSIESSNGSKTSNFVGKALYDFVPFPFNINDGCSADLEKDSIGSSHIF